MGAPGRQGKNVPEVQKIFKGRGKQFKKHQMNIPQHLENQIQYYEREVKRIEKMDSPDENNKAYATVAKIMIKSLKAEEKKLLKVK